MAAHGGDGVTRRGEHMVAGHHQAVARECVEEILVQVGIAGPDHHELVSGVGPQGFCDLGLGQERSEPGGRIVVLRGEGSYQRAKRLGHHDDAPVVPLDGRLQLALDPRDLLGDVMSTALRDIGVPPDLADVPAASQSGVSAEEEQRTIGRVLPARKHDAATHCVPIGEVVDVTSHERSIWFSAQPFSSIAALRLSSYHQDVAVPASKHRYLGVQGRGTIALPADVRRRLHLDEPGAQLEMTERADGVIELRPALPVPADQRWFWTERWQEREREVDDQVAAGHVTVFESTEDFLLHLDELADS